MEDYEDAETFEPIPKKKFRGKRRRTNTVGKITHPTESIPRSSIHQHNATLGKQAPGEESQ